MQKRTKRFDTRTLMFLPDAKTNWPLDELKDQIAEIIESAELVGFRLYNTTGLMVKTNQPNHKVKGQLIMFKDFRKLYDILDKAFDEGVKFHRLQLVYDEVSQEYVYGYCTVAGDLKNQFKREVK